MSEPAFRATGLRKEFGPNVAVHGLDLEIPVGQFFALLGPNGAGKTTTISMLAGVLTPTRGQAWVGGHDVRARSRDARQVLGLVPQEIALYDDLSARDNLKFFGRIYGLRADALSAAIARSLSLSGLETRSSDAVRTYSGGMKRRLNLAVGLLHSPRFLICDEPTVGIDPQSRAHLYAALRGLHREGLTVVYTSHYMAEVEDLCDRVGIIDGGRLVACDALPNLLAEHAESHIEIEVEHSVELASQHLPGSTLLGDRLSVPTTYSVTEVLKKLDGLSIPLRRLEMRRATLESVFLNLTGRHLRDDS